MREDSAAGGAGRQSTDANGEAMAALVHEMRNALNAISVASQLIDSKIVLMAGLISRLEAVNSREGGVGAPDAAAARKDGGSAPA